MATAIAAIDRFSAKFGAPSSLVRAPGRVNLIGEHTDYNRGFVLPMALDRAVWIAMRPRPDDTVRLVSQSFDEEREFRLSDYEPEGLGWIELAKGVADRLQQRGTTLRGFDGVVGGDVPIGAGLSSSAAFGIAIARAFAATSGFDWDPVAMAEVVQRAEGEWLGVRCGIMDPLVSAAAVADCALLIDCRALQISVAPLPAGAEIVVLDTGSRRTLADSLYNERRSHCESAAHALGAESLRDVNLRDLEAAASRGTIDERTLRRARHVVTENERTLLAVEAMACGDLVGWGALIDASHRSLRDDFECSSDALDIMVDVARRHDACFGARLTGAGFAGCALALVDSTRTEEFITSTMRLYEEEAGHVPQCHASRGTAGAMELDLDFVSERPS
ncbi:MAG: galactokinase [Planctomycetes bacterium]|nr:galactokinase [Planctomycetota bacterium]